MGILDVCFVIAVCLVMSGAAVEVSYPFNGTESSSVNKSCMLRNGETFSSIVNINIIIHIFPTLSWEYIHKLSWYDIIHAKEERRE